ncbi:MAG: NAD-dependent epimerase/dehydratase family protein [Flavobacteriaceae bacterium]|jgi:threonine 3-dehydrogenase|nr:NAD-dependent epimerase/dehydratase family protein [Formosa sp.]MDG1374810.1 NAD-dependent epimerase/dehydratase family protein [Flavobacteriaceae bacterium]MDG2499370.1 NAD-dependent epimerase/dehydratase family protein [Flavobacteriaceae bacterium]
MQEKILITGAGGQLGSVLTLNLQEKFGINHVIATDLYPSVGLGGHFEILDATDFQKLESIIVKNSITQIYHLAAVLSASGEKTPVKTWDLNMKTLINVLEVSRIHGVQKVFFPSSIAVFGNNASKDHTSQDQFLLPSTIYGISKATGENWAHYYYNKYGLDVRSLRYPGVIGYESIPGGGTTDYAVDIFHKAIHNQPFECFLSASTQLPMIYMEDAIRATIELMDAPKQNITIRSSYNISGMSFSPNQLFLMIRKTYPKFTITYKPDFRQQIADTWPHSIDDSKASKDWGWIPKYDLESMTESMIKNLKLKHQHYT